MPDTETTPTADDLRALGRDLGLLAEALRSSLGPTLERIRDLGAAARDVDARERLAAANDELSATLAEVESARRAAVRRVDELEREVETRERRINELGVALVELAHPETKAEHGVDVETDIDDHGVVLVRITPRGEPSA